MRRLILSLCLLGTFGLLCCSQATADVRILKIRYTTKDSLGDQPDVIIRLEFDGSGRLLSAQKEANAGGEYAVRYQYSIHYEGNSIVVFDLLQKKETRRIVGSYVVGYSENLSSGIVLHYDVRGSCMYRGIQNSLTDRPTKFCFDSGMVNILYGTPQMTANQLMKTSPSLQIIQQKNGFRIENIADAYHHNDIEYRMLDDTGRRFQKYYLNSDGTRDELTTRIYDLSYSMPEMGMAKYFNWELFRVMDEDGDLDPIAFGMLLGNIGKASSIKDFFE